MPLTSTTPLSPVRLVPVALAAAAAACSAPAADALPGDSGTADAGAPVQETYSLAGERIAIYNLAGEIELRSRTGGEVRVAMETGGEDRERLRVATGEIDDRQTLRVLYPEDRIVYPDGGSRETALKVRDDGTFGGDRPWRGREVRIGDGGSGLRAHADLVVEVPEGKRVAVYLGVGPLRSVGVSADLVLDTHVGAVEVREHRGDLEVDTGSGSVHLRSVSGGAVGVDTGSGSVRLAGVRADRLLVDTGSGQVRGDGLETPELEIDTGSGGIAVRDVTTRRVVLDTGSGSVRLGLASDVDEMEIDTGSGSVEVTVPDVFGSELALETGSGGIQLDLPGARILEADEDADDIMATVGDGRGRTVIDTGSGTVRIRRQ